MSIEDKRREGFESWWAKYAFLSDYEVRQKRRGESYCGVMLAAAWSAWNDSLDSVVIELPYMPRANYANQHSFNCATEAMGWAREAIESAGLKVK